VIATSLAPELLNVTAHVKLLDCVKVIALLPALKLEVPGTVNAPVWVIAPFDVIDKLLPTLDAANTVAMLLTNETLLVPLLEKVTAPDKLLPAVFNVIALLPAVKLDVPGTTNAPVCVIAPPAVADKLPPLVKVTAGNAIAALSNIIVKLRKLVKPAKLGIVEPAFTLRIEISRIFASDAGAVLLNKMPVPKSFAN